MHYRLLALFALLTPTLADERVLSWIHHLDARHNQEASVPDGAIADAAMRTPAWLQTLQNCIDDFGKDPFLHNWQGNTCHGWGFFKGREPAGLYKNPADCYQFGQGWMQFYATQGVTDVTFRDIWRRSLAPDILCYIGYHWVGE